MDAVINFLSDPPASDEIKTVNDTEEHVNEYSPWARNILYASVYVSVSIIIILIIVYYMRGYVKI